MTQAATLDDIRFKLDIDLYHGLLEEERLAGRLQSKAAYEQYRKTVRTRLLCSAVRVDARMLPKLDASIVAMRERARFEREVEAYVFEDPTINAFMIDGEHHTFLGISSGAVNRLSSRELEFVIGHELGHALFQHINAETIVEDEDALGVRLRQKLFAWRRACEISADRCGLVCCGDLDIAAMTIFRSLSGLGDRELSVRPDDFAEQWDHLLAEVVRGGEEDLWENTHPFPPLRMKAMLLFWLSDAPLLPVGREGVTSTLANADDDVRRLLATMDPLAREQAGTDRILEDFHLWGGLCLATANGAFDPAARRALEGMVARGAVERGLQLASTPERMLANFKGALGKRRRRLKSLEITKILKSVLHVGHAKGKLTEKDVETFNALGSALGIAEHACDVIRERFEEEKRS